MNAGIVRRLIVRRLIVRRLIVTALVGAVVLLVGGCGYLEEKPDPNDPAAQAAPIGTFETAQGFTRQYYRVPADLPRQKFIELATAVHEEDPTAWLWFMDDESQIQQLLESLPRTEQGDYEGFPRDWVNRHTVGNSVVEIGGGQPATWVLFEGAERSNRLASMPMPT